MSDASVDKMLLEMRGYFAKVKAALATAGAANSKYVTGSVAANGTTTIDAPSLLDFTAGTHFVYSTGIQISIVDPMVSTNPPITGGEAVIRYEIQNDGKILLRNNYAGSVTYHIRLTVPVKR